MRRDTDHVADIVNAARRVCKYLLEVDKTQFDEDLIVQDAVIRQLLIVGEATKRLPAEFRVAHPDVPGTTWPPCAISSCTHTIEWTWEKSGALPKRISRI